MENKINSLLINAKDSVAVAIEELEEGSIASYKNVKGIKEVNIIQNIPIYHKFAITNIKAGELVYKYGQIIGKATQDIKIGQHIHTHNIVSIREAIEG